MGILTALSAVTSRDGDVYAVELAPEHEVVFKLPSIKRADQFNKIIAIVSQHGDPALFNKVIEHVFQFITEDDFVVNKNDDIPAGVPESIVNLMLHMCGFSSLDYTLSLLDECRKGINSGNTINFMQRIICKVFSAYTFEITDRLSYPELVRVFAEAENLLIENGVITAPYKFSSSEEREKKPFSMDKEIHKDIREYSQFNGQEEGDRISKLKSAALMEKLRNEADAKAEVEERNFNLRQGR